MKMANVGNKKVNKDALTDLVSFTQTIDSQSSNSNDGKVIASDGTLITLSLGELKMLIEKACHETAKTVQIQNLEILKDFMSELPVMMMPMIVDLIKRNER